MILIISKVTLFIEKTQLKCSVLTDKYVFLWCKPKHYRFMQHVQGEERN